MKDSLKIAIAGATGYTGLELTKILSSHPKAKILYLCAQKSIGKPISFFDKRIKKKSLPRISNTKKINWKKIDVLFAALPNGEGQKIAKKLPINVKLIDLSADFRLKDSKAYKKLSFEAITKSKFPSKSISAEAAAPQTSSPSSYGKLLLKELFPF